MTLEFKDVQFFRAEETEKAGKQILVVSGLAFHSSMTVSGIEEVREDDFKILIVNLSLAEPSKSGSFEYEIIIEPELNSIKFGKEKHEIWSRTR